MFGFMPSWLPTKQDELQFRKDELKHLREELPRIARNFSQESDKLCAIEKGFFDSLDETQKEMFLEMQATSQKVQFNYSRMIYNKNRTK